MKQVKQVIRHVFKWYEARDSNPSLETRGVFLDISKAFDRVWHDGLLFKSKQNGVSGNLLRLIFS